MKRFTQHKDIPNLTPRKNKNWKLRVSLVFGTFLFVFFGLFVYLLDEYVKTHTFKFQSPVIVQKPVIIKRVEIISPLATKSAMLNYAYAEEITNPYDPRSPKGIAWEMVKEKFGIDQWGYFEELIQRESSWNPYAINSSSGAAGLPQSLPAYKMDCELWDYECQITWVGGYIQDRYENPEGSIQFHNKSGWY